MYKWRPLNQGYRESIGIHDIVLEKPNRMMCLLAQWVLNLSKYCILASIIKLSSTIFCKKKKKKKKKRVTVHPFKSSNNANEWVLYYILIDPFGKPSKSFLQERDYPLMEFLSWLYDQKYLIASMGQTGRKMKRQSST